MNKLFLTTMLAAYTVGMTNAETKQQKIEQLFEINNDKTSLVKLCEMYLSNANITDEKIKQDAIDKFFATFKQGYVTAYDKIFSEVDIDEMLKYYRSATGQRIMATITELNTEMQKAYGSIKTIIQDILTEQEKANNTIKTTAVIHFDEKTKDKNDAEIRELFNKEIQHDGLTIVKFSGTWCPPCKIYAPVFEEVAEQLKELSIDGKKVAIKYLAIDVDAVKVISEDCSIMSIPATIFYKNGKKVDSKIGNLKKDILKSNIEELAK